MICSHGLALFFAYWGIFHAFFKNQLYRKMLSGIPSRVSNNLAPDQAQLSVRLDLGPNCSQRLSAEDTSRQNVKRILYEAKTKRSNRKYISTVTCERALRHFDTTVKMFYNVIHYSRIFNIRQQFSGNRSVSIKIPSL